MLVLPIIAGTAGVSAQELAGGCRLTIGAEVYNVPVGKPFAVQIGEQRVTMRIDPRSQTDFTIEGVSFSHPASLVAETPVDEGGVAIWAIQGPSSAIMLQRYDGELAPESLLKVLADNIAEQYGKQPIQRQAVQLRGADRTYPGQQLRVSTTAASGQGATAGQGVAEGTAVDLVQNVFTFASGDRVYALIVQDTRPAGGGETPEYQETLRLLGETLKTAPSTPKPAASATPQRSVPRRR
ncbi:hypothetical protein Pla111_01420 [Botrimarina hoheduenensis]|uniref:Uncharacterized protein n=1 Tax=Botrimarina hoheduenensis TaxID=2528000 RepID=A0A5C5WE88_9BACT|nr:hypothetical protein Pla111_01420 [Botrimarina hoheduenensis]